MSTTAGGRHQESSNSMTVWPIAFNVMILVSVGVSR